MTPFQTGGGLAGLSSRVNQALAQRAAGDTLAAAPALPPAPTLPEPSLPPVPEIVAPTPAAAPAPVPTIAAAPTPTIAAAPAPAVPALEERIAAAAELPPAMEIRQALGIPLVAPEPQPAAEMPTIASAADAVRRTRERLAGRRGRASTVLTSRRARGPDTATPATLPTLAAEAGTYARRTLG